MILAVLPLRPITIFASKLVALSSFVLSFGIAVNIMGALFSLRSYSGTRHTRGVDQVRSIPRVATLAASVGGALLVVVAAGLLLNVAPHSAVRRFSSWLQFFVFVFFVTQIFLALK